MTAMPADRPAQIQQGTSAAACALAQVVACVERAQDRAGTRSGAHDLLDLAAVIERARPVVRLALRARHDGELPLQLRMHLSILARGETYAHETGTAGTGIVAIAPECLIELHGALDACRASCEALVRTLA
jgi:hypothetical protein